MPTFKPMVFRHQKRKDGRFPISIRVTHNRRSAYLPTCLYADMSQINRKTFEIKDTFIIERMNTTIREMSNRLLSFSIDEIANMSAIDIKSILSAKEMSVDYLAYCDEKVAEDAKKWGMLRSVVNIIKNDMGIQRLPVQQLNTRFLNSLKKTMDERVSVHGTKLLNLTKNTYLTIMGTAFNCMKAEFNTEYVTIIKGNPFENIDRYPRERQKKRSTDVESLRKFFAHKARARDQSAIDAAKISFCMCGMNVADMFEIKPSCYDGERITYERKKTRNRRADNALISIKVEPEIKDLIEKYSGNKERLLDIGGGRVASTWTNVFNGKIKKICKELEIPRMTMYWFRHTWATIARNNCGVSKDDVDLCLDHVGNNPMADIYIDEDWSRIDKINRKVLDFVFKNIGEES